MLWARGCGSIAKRTAAATFQHLFSSSCTSHPSWFDAITKCSLWGAETQPNFLLTVTLLSVPSAS